MLLLLLIAIITLFSIFRILFIKKLLSSLFIATTLFSSIASAKFVGDVETSGLFFKDTIEIHGFKDPTLKGIGCHVTFADKSMSFDNPTDSSIACRQIADTIVGNYKKHESDIFSKSKNLFFKTMRVDRFYDPETHTLIYISYVRKVEGENAAHSISSVPLYSAKLKK